MPRNRFNSKHANDHGFLQDLGVNIIDPNALEDIDYSQDEPDTSNAQPVKTYSIKPSDIVKRMRESKNPRIKYLRQNANNIMKIAAHYAYMDVATRNSKYKCPECNGQKNGGNKRMPVSRITEQKYCSTCGNTGHTLSKPEQTIFNLKKSAEEWNTNLNFHDTYCTAKACHNACQFKDEIDKNCRTGIDRHELKKKDTHLRPGTTNSWLLNNMRPKVVQDNYKGFAPFLRAVGGHEDDPLQEGDFCQFLHHDTVNPDTDLKKRDQGFHPFKESYDEMGKPTGACAVGGCGKGKSDINHIERQRPQHEEAVYEKGGRDKQMTAIIANVSDDGKCDAFIHYRPIDLVRRELENRERVGNKEERAIKMHSTLDAMHLRGDDDQGDRDLQHHLKNSNDEVLPMFGEKSPLTGVGRWKFERGLPIERFARVSPVTAPLLATSGVTTEIVPKSRIRGTYPGGSWLKRRKNKSDGTSSAPDESKTKVDISHRVALGSSTDEIRNIPLNTEDPDTIEEFRNFAKRWDDRLGIQPGHPLSISPTTQGTAVSEQHRKNRSIEEPESKSFNSGSFGELEVPSVQVPSGIKMTETPQGRKNILDVVSKHLDRELNPQEQKLAIEGVREENHINGALRKFNESTGEEE